MVARKGRIPADTAPTVTGRVLKGRVTRARNDTIITVLTTRSGRCVILINHSASRGAGRIIREVLTGSGGYGTEILAPQRSEIRARIFATHNALQLQRRCLFRTIFGVIAVQIEVEGHLYRIGRLRHHGISAAVDALVPGKPSRATANPLGGQRHLRTFAVGVRLNVLIDKLVGAAVKTHIRKGNGIA